MDGFKQRIIGALVLICLAIIFVPMLFEKPHDKSATQTIQIPSEPKSQSITIKKPHKPALKQNASAGSPSMSAPTSSTMGQTAAQGSEAAGTSSSATAISSAASMPATPTSSIPSTAGQQTSRSAKPAPKAEAQPSAASSTSKPQGKWLVQLGSFGEEKNADSLRRKVRAKGFAAFLKTVHSGGRTLTRVIAGPFSEKADAESAKKALDRDFGIKSLMMVNNQDD